MTAKAILEHLDSELASIEEAGLCKKEREIEGPQGSTIATSFGEELNFCANNYLGLANDPEIVDAAKAGMDTHGFGMASVRFICGTQDIHKQLERKVADFLGTEDAILYSSCFDANAGLFEILLGPEDAIISDALNHASIIDGVRLCKAQRNVYKHSDMADLEARLQETQDARFRLVVTDGVFSMHGDLALLPEICDLTEKYDALLVVDDSHATGFLGPQGRGTADHYGVSDRIDVYTSTLGKALGGASGGFTAGPKQIVDILRQRSRPYLFSNALAPSIVSAALTAIDIVDNRPELRETLWNNTRYFREQIVERGFDVTPGIHPIVPIMLGDEQKTVEMAKAMNDRGIFVVGFSFPVVPRGEARIRVQISAAHSREQLDTALDTFTEVGREVGVLSA